MFYYISKNMCLLLLLFYVKLSQEYGVALKNRQKDYSLKTSIERLPSHTREVRLLAANLFYLTIDQNGEVGATKDMENPDAILKMESYSIKHKRIKRLDLNRSFYLAIDKNGKIRTRRKPKRDTLFIEKPTDDGFRLWYENNATRYYLAITENKETVDGVTTDNKYNFASQFQQILL